MELNRLDFVDFLQVISLVLALGIGFLPNVISTKSNDNRVSPFGMLMIALFLLCLSATFFSTISKSSADKKAYNDLFDSTTLVLDKATNNIIKSDSILNLQNKNIDELKKLQENAKQIQQQGILLTYKSDLIQAKSEQLNTKLRQEIDLQKATTKVADSIVNKITNQDRNTERNNQLRLLLCITTMMRTNLIIYNGMHQVGTDYKKYITELVAENNKRLFESKRPLNIGDSLKKDLKDDSTIVNSVIYRMNNIINVYIADLRRSVIYAIEDSAKITNAITEFLNQNLALLDSQLGNPIVQKNNKLFDLWLKYFGELNEKRSIYFLDKSSLNSIDKIKQLTKSQDEFITRVNRNTKLEVVLDNK